MFDSILLNLIVLILSVMIAANGYFVVKGFIRWYRITNYAVLKTHITRHELQKIIDSRRGFSR